VPELGGPGGPLAPPIFGRAVNPIPTGGGQIIPHLLLLAPQNFSPSGITDLEKKQIKETRRCDLHLKSCYRRLDSKFEFCSYLNHVRRAVKITFNKKEVGLFINLLLGITYKIKLGL
jgi:hypothetical protein